MRGDWSDADALGAGATSSASASAAAAAPAPAAAATSSQPQPPPLHHSQLQRRRRRRRDRLLGLACVLSVATVWAGASFVVAGVEAAGLPPLVLTYVANSLFVLYLPAYALVIRARRRKKRSIGQGGGEGGGGRRKEEQRGQQQLQLDDFNFGGIYSGLKDVEREEGGGEDGDDSSSSSFPLVPRPREGPRLCNDAPPLSSSPLPPAAVAPPPTPLNDDERSPAFSSSSSSSSSPPPSSAPLLSPQNSWFLAFLDSCLLSRLLLPPLPPPQQQQQQQGDSPPLSSTTTTTVRRRAFFSRLRLTAEERSVVLAAVVVAPLWFGAQLSFNASLTRTSVTSNTILSTAASLFTYPLAVLVLREPATAKKALSVAVCVAGVVAVALADSSATARGGSGRSGGSGSGSSPSPSPSPSPPPPSSSPKRTLAGDALVLLSCVLYAGYTVAVRALLVDEDGGAATMLFFGCVGLINFAAGLPFLALALVAPRLFLSPAAAAAARSPRLVAATVAKGLLDNVLSDYLWARAVLLIGPTVATVGLNVQVPLAAGLDAVLGKPKPRWTTSAPAAALTAVGAAAVVGGVCGIAAGGSE